MPGSGVRSDIQFRNHLAGILRARASEVTDRWIATLEERNGGDSGGRLLVEMLRTTISACMTRIADYVEAPDAEPDDLRRFMRRQMGRLAHARRASGVGIAEALEQCELLGSRLQAMANDAAGEYDGTVDPADLVSTTGRFRDATALFGLGTARAYFAWEARARRDRAVQTSSFAAMLRHELRNRLGSAQTAGELLAEDDIDPERRKRLAELVVRSLERGLETVDVVREVVTEELPSGKPQMWMPLVNVVQSVGHRSVLSPAGIDVDFGHVPDVRVPAARVSMILLNLVGNAVKYHDESKDERWIRMETDILGENDDGSQWARITIADNGCGIDPSLHDSLFDFEVRGDESANGSGLGLALSREMVQQLGGRIYLDSEPGVGTRVSIVVPVASVNPDAEP